MCTEQSDYGMMLKIFGMECRGEGLKMKFDKLLSKQKLYQTCIVPEILIDADHAQRCMCMYHL